MTCEVVAAVDDEVVLEAAREEETVLSPVGSVRFERLVLLLRFGYR